MNPTRDQAAEGRDRGISDAEEGVDPGWLAKALAAIRRTAESREEFISDDVWSDTKLPETRENRALGPIFLAAVRKGWIQKTDRVRPSVRSHLSGKPVWRSLICKRKR